jgi:hypothetical protein
MSISLFDIFLAFLKKIRSVRYHPGERVRLLFDSLFQVATVYLMKDSSRMHEGWSEKK